MNNDYEIRGETTAVIIRRRDGSIYESLVDTADLPRVKEFPSTWTLLRANGPDYVRGTLYQGNYRKKTYLLHRWILNAPKGKFVDHINGNGLDNRRSNLRLVTHAQNHQNRLGPNPNSRSGILGVHWSAQKNKWHVRFSVNGRRRHVGYYECLDEAAESAKAARARMLPFSQEARLSKTG